MAKPLLDRIAADLKPTGRIADCRRDLAEAEQERAEVSAKIVDAERRASDPSIADADARLSRQQADDWQFHARRLDRGILELRQALAEKEAAEQSAERLNEFADAASERDALVERWRELGAWWDAIAPLLHDTAENDRRLARVNNHRPAGEQRLASAEIVARGALNDSYWPNSIGMNGEPFTRLTVMRLPFFGKPGIMWPAAADSIARHLADQVGAGLAASALARAPQTIAAAKLREAQRFTRYEVLQACYRGHPVMNVKHRDGAAAVGNKPVMLWMDAGQASAAEKLGLVLKGGAERLERSHKQLDAIGAQ